MTRRRAGCVGLFLAFSAAFALGIGHSNVALAAGEAQVVTIQKAMETETGRAALQKTGISPEKFKAMLAKLPEDKRRELAAKVSELAPKATLVRKMMAEGYTASEAAERLALLTDDEIARFADSPDATVAGAGDGVTWAVLVLIVLVVVLVVTLYFVTEPTPEPPPPSPAGS